LNLKSYRDTKKQFNRKTNDALQPVSPLQGPVTISHPKAFNKIYRWCSCGLSLKQPFCDGSH
jgi:CDGSH-type Zn-finger protein